MHNIHHQFLGLFLNGHSFFSKVPRAVKKPEEEEAKPEKDVKVEPKPVIEKIKKPEGTI